MKRIILMFVVLVAIVGYVLHDSHAKSNFVMIKLPNGVSVDIHRNWQVATKDQRITLAIQVQLDLSNLSKVTSDLGFIAGYFDDAGDKAKINVRYYPDMKVTQDAVRQANPEEIRKFE